MNPSESRSVLIALYFIYSIQSAYCKVYTVQSELHKTQYHITYFFAVLLTPLWYKNLK